MAYLWSTVQSFLEIVSDFTMRVFKIFSTPLGELTDFGDTFIGEWFEDALNTFFGLFGQDVTLFELTFTVGLAIFVVVALVKFFI
jgi:hypothetical protein